MINLGQNWGVKDSGLLAYKQVGSRFFNKDFDFTRASNGTYVDKDGVLQTAELYNLITYSNFNSGWVILGSKSRLTYNETIAPDGSMNGVKLEQILTTNDATIRFTGLSIGVEYTLSVYAKKGNYDNLQIDISDQATAFTLTDDWVRYEITETATANFVDITIRSGSIGDYIYIYGAQLVEGTEPRDYQYTNGRVGIPRIDFSDGVGALLLEPQRTNLLLQSNSFDTTWVKIVSSITEGQDGIYGSNDAWLLSKSAANGRIYQSVSYSGTNTASVYVKPSESTWFRFYFDGIATSIYYDLENATIGSTYGAGFVSADIEYIENGWYRCRAVINGSGNTIRMYAAEENSASGTSGSIYIQHAQLESGSYPTSIIETTTSQVTRIADVANNCGTEQDFNSEEGVLYFEAKTENDNVGSISINDGTLSNRVTARFRTDISKVQLTVVGTTDDFNYNSVTITLSEYNKVAIVYDNGQYYFFVNGVKSTIQNKGTFDFNDLTQLDFNRGGGSEGFYGKVRSVKYFPTALTDEELQNLTT